MTKCHYLDEDDDCNIFGNRCEDHLNCIPFKTIKGHDKLIEPKSPLRENFMNDNQYMKARKQYKTDRTRYLKALKHRDSGSMLVDHSVAQTKSNKKYRTMKDSQWKAEQNNANPQTNIFVFNRCKWVNCKKQRYKDAIYCKEHFTYSNKISENIDKRKKK